MPELFLDLPAILAERRRRATEASLRGGLEIVRARCVTLEGFIREAWPILEPGNPYVHGWHIGLIAAHLEAITYGRLLEGGLENRLLINIPPRCMKTIMVSILWPAFEWGPAGMPHLRYLSTSFSDKNVSEHSRKMRDLVESDWYRTLWPDVQLTRRAETDFENSRGGRRQGRPFPSLTGGGGERLLIDDPHSTETAESEADRGKAIRIFRESVPSRINDAKTSAIVLIMQRLHEQDCSGLAMSMKLGYTAIILPMEFEPDRRFDSPLGPEFSDPRTEVGELLFPERFPRETVERDKIPLGAVGVAGQYQQRPVPRGGMTFKRKDFPVVAAAPAECRWVRGWDFAATEKKGAAFTAGLKLGRDRFGVFYIGHVTRARVSNPETFVVAVASQDGKLVEIDFPQDPGQAGKVQVRAISAALVGYLAYSSPESGDKETRALAVAAQAEAGNFRIVQGGWNEEFLNELELFPNSAFKDQIDALSRAFGRFVLSPAAAVVVPMVITTPSTHFGDHP